MVRHEASNVVDAVGVRREFAGTGWDGAGRDVVGRGHDGDGEVPKHVGHASQLCLLVMGPDLHHSLLLVSTDQSFCSANFDILYVFF